MGRVQMVLFLAQKNGWVLVSDVFKHAHHDGITTPHGARKALMEIEYVELKNTTSDVRPTYECRLEPTIEALQNIMYVIRDDGKAHRVFIQSVYFREWVPKLAHQFNEIISTHETLNDAGLDAVERLAEHPLPGNSIKSVFESGKKRLRDLEDIANDPTLNENGRMALNESEIKELEFSIRCSWLTARFIVNFLMHTPQMQKQMFFNAKHDMTTIMPLAKDNWMLFFNMLDQLNFNYGFLFDTKAQTPE